MTTDNDFFDQHLPPGWHTSANAVAFTPTPEWYSCDNQPDWREMEHDVIVYMPPKRRYVQPLVLFLPLALWRWLLRKVRYR